MPHLRLSFIPFLFAMNMNNQSRMAGFQGALFDTICVMMNTTYTASMPPELSWGDCNETSCTGMFAPLMTNDSDVALGPHSLLYTYAQHFEPGAPIAFERFSIISGMQRAYGLDSTALLKVLDSTVYIIVILLPWAVAGLVMLVTRFQSAEVRKEDAGTSVDLGVLVVAGYQTILNQGAEYSSRANSSRLVVMSYTMVAMIVTVLYSSFVKASMMETPPTKRMAYIRDVINEKDLRPMICERNFITDLIKAQAEVNPDYFKLNQMLEEWDLVDVSYLYSSESVDAILNGTAFTIFPCRWFKYFFVGAWKEISKTNRGFFYCGIEDVLTTHTTWYFNRNSVDRQFIREFNRRTRWLMESPQRFLREHEQPQIPSWIRVYDAPLSEENEDQISVDNIMGPIFIYIGGISLGSASFLIEYGTIANRYIPSIAAGLRRKT